MDCPIKVRNLANLDQLQVGDIFLSDIGGREESIVHIKLLGANIKMKKMIW